MLVFLTFLLVDVNYCFKLLYISKINDLINKHKDKTINKHKDKKTINKHKDKTINKHKDKTIGGLICNNIFVLLVL